ncbi:MAG: hypothetical protein AMXMBFR47_39370 [Planctomycetota bacterium]
MSAEPITPANVADFRFRAADFSTDDLRVTAFSGIEAISRLFSFRIRLSSEIEAINPEQILGKDATLEIDGEYGTRAVHGIVRSFGRIGEGSHLVHYEAELVPPHWLLSRRIQSRVFNAKRCQRMDVIGVVSKVLADAGLTEDDLKLAIARDYEPREFVVQYRESDWDFISRLLESEGIYYHFEQTAERCKLVLIDSKGLCGVFSSPGDVPFRKPTGMIDDQECIYAGEFADRVQIGMVSLDDFNFRQPDQPLRQSSAGRQFTNLSLTEHPGGYDESGRGKRLAETRLEEQLCEQRILNLASTVRAFWPGSRFSLTGHPEPGRDGDYLVQQLNHRATQSQSAEEESLGDTGCRYEAEIRVIPAATQFRPPRATPRPTVLGSQTALVVGPPGEEIHVDEFGRVEVRFHWDQEWGHDVGASCWIRVSQGWAGGQYGMMFLPRVGQEVIVDFLEGDPDRPIITGRVYNKDHMPAYKLPDHRTISSIRTCSSPGAKGGNEIRFEDAKGAEQMLLYAQNSMHFRARGSRFESIGGDAHKTIAGNVVSLVKRDKYEAVNLDFWEEVKGSCYRYVKGDRKEHCQGIKLETVDGRYCLTNERGGIHINSDESVTLSCGGNFIKIDAEGVSIVASRINLNSGGAKGPAEALNLMILDDPPIPAASTEFGHNTHYSSESHVTPTPPPAESQQETSWIEIELVDELGQPVPGEAYTVMRPDGKQVSGTLDATGQAHVAVPDPGLCKVTFPRLDAAAWEPVG